MLFCQKNDALISGFAFMKKAPSPWKKFLKKILQAYLSRYDLQNGVHILTKWVSRYLSFGDFKILKNGSFTIKLLLKLVSIGGHISSTQIIQTGIPQSSVLGSLLFLLYINDLNKSIKTLKAYHFADNTNILLSDESLELLAKKMNQNLKNLSQWLKANKLSLNVKKTDLIIFYPKNTILDYSVKFKLNGRRLTLQYNFT